MKNGLSVLFLLVFSTACSMNFERRESTKSDSAASENAVQRENGNVQIPATTENQNAEIVKQSINPRGGQTIDGQIKADCLKNRRGGKVPDAKQTFVMDFEPFRDACFVTFHDAEYTNPPLGSEVYVYRDGKPIFQFPAQLNGATCWVEAVSFVDLNGDELKDIIIAGMCGAKAGAYSENIVYANTGEGFKTNEDANFKLADFKRIKDIENFVRRNRQLFFK